MDTLYRAALHTHQLVALLLIVAQLSFWAMKPDPFIPFVRRFRVLFLVQNVLLAMLIFTGLLLMAVLRFELWNPKIVAMILLAVAMVANQIRIHRRLRPIRSDERELQKEWRRFVWRIYLGQSVAAAILFLLSKVA